MDIRKFNLLIDNLRAYDKKQDGGWVEDCMDTLKEGDYTLEDYIDCMVKYWIPDWIEYLTEEDEHEKRKDLRLLREKLIELK